MRRDDIGLLPTDVINTRRQPDATPSSLPSGGSDNAALIAAINSLGAKFDGLAAQISALGGTAGGSGLLPGCIPPNGQAVQFETINLTSAHTNYEITLTGCATYCHAWCDGHMDGVTVKMRDQSAIPVELGRVNGFPILSNTFKVWVTNDVRPGRSILILGFGVGESMSNVDMKTELNELAARLGSLVSYDRRGRFVWGDDFSGTQLRWAATTVGAGGAGLTSAMTYQGDQCAHVGTGAVANNYTCMHRFIHLPLDKNIGMQCAFRLDASFDDALMYFMLQVYNGTNLLNATFRIMRVATVWTASYLNSAGAYTDVLTTWAPRLSDTWHRMKIVMDGTNSRWVRAMLDDRVMDLSNLALRSTADTTQGLDMHIETMTLGAAVRESWIDAVVLTDCEPVDILH
jgi:hypothetical protein